MKNGFALVELLIVIGILMMLASLVAPSIVRLQYTTDIHIISQKLLHVLERARTAARASQDDSAWGVHVSATTGIVLFQGTSYATRNTSFDEVIASIPQYILVTSTFDTPTEVVFAKLTGDASVTGSFVMVEVFSHTEHRITVDDSTGGIYQDDTIVICHHPGEDDATTMNILQSQLPGHRIHGDRVGAC